MLLSFLKIRVVVNGKEIYPLLSDRPVVITVQENHPKIVVTDGFHHTKPLELVYHHLHTYYFKVVCAIGDVQLLAGLLMLALLYLLGFYSGIFVIKTDQLFSHRVFFVSLLYQQKRIHPDNAGIKIRKHLQVPEYLLSQYC